jgi:hypothetical protein
VPKDYFLCLVIDSGIVMEKCRLPACWQQGGYEGPGLAGSKLPAYKIEKYHFWHNHWVPDAAREYLQVGIGGPHLGVGYLAI